MDIAWALVALQRPGAVTRSMHDPRAGRRADGVRWRVAVLGALLGTLAAVLLVIPLRYWRGVPSWSLEGFAMTLCPCGTPCPCRSGAAPTHDRCEATTFVDVVTGHYGDVRLDGVRFVTVADMHRGRWLVAYGEAAAPGEAREAMLHIAENMVMPRTFFAPVLAPILRPRITVRTVERIEYETAEDGLRRRVRIPGLLELDARLRADAAGRPRQLVPALDLFGNWIAYADNLVYRYGDPAVGLNVDYSGRQANMKSFRVAKEDYDANRLLAQEASAMRGSWTPHQRALIAALRAQGGFEPRRLAH